MKIKRFTFLMSLFLLLPGPALEAAGAPAPAACAEAAAVTTGGAGVFSYVRQRGDCLRFRRVRVRGRWRRICVRRAGGPTPADGTGENTGGGTGGFNNLLTVTPPRPPGWPNLDVLDDFPAPGRTCSIFGSADPATNREKACSNSLKNRYVLPPGGFAPMLLSEMMRVPLGPNGAAPSCSNNGNGRAVSVVGFVKAVKVAGCRFGESSNCGSQVREQCDAHIELVLDPNDNAAEGRGMVVVEVTDRIRRLASRGLLRSNIGNDWSTQNLRARLQGRWVRFSGWLFYDPDHHLESWQADPDDTRSRNTGPGGRPRRDNWRATGWEVHPVMSIETNVGRPLDAVNN